MICKNADLKDQRLVKGARNVLQKIKKEYVKVKLVLPGEEKVILGDQRNSSKILKDSKTSTQSFGVNEYCPPQPAKKKRGKSEFSLPDHFKTLIIKDRRKSEALWWASILNNLDTNLAEHHNRRVEYNLKTAEEKDQDCLEGRYRTEQMFKEFYERNVQYEAVGG
jgi:hypothetical protein